MTSLLKYLWLVCACMAGSVHAQTTVDPTFHIYLLLGQSNMAGRGEVTEAYKEQLHPRVLSLSKEGAWETAKHPLHFDKPKVAGVGPGLSFGIAMAEADSNITIGLVPGAVGGTSINTWVPGGFDAATKTHPYDDAIKNIEIAKKAGVIKGILWMQGESDASKSEEYLPKLTALINKLRVVAGNPQLPFVAAELGRYKPAYSKITATINQLPAHVPFTAVVSSEGLMHKGDSVHLDSPSATLLGQRFAHQMKLLQRNLTTSTKTFAEKH